MIIRPSQTPFNDEYDFVVGSGADGGPIAANLALSGFDLDAGGAGAFGFLTRARYLDLPERILARSPSH